MIFSVFNALRGFFYKLSSWYGKWTVVSFILVVTILTGYMLFSDNEDDLTNSAQENNKTTYVRVSKIASLDTATEINLVGKVSAVNEAKIETETSGRVTAVNVKIGDRITAGSIVATLENASERASLLQAEGNYEAALASASQSDIGLSEAELALSNTIDSAKTTYLSAYTTVSGILSNSIDQVYSEPDSSIIGVKISGTAYTSELISRRKDLGVQVKNWFVGTNEVRSEVEIIESLIQADSVTLNAITLVDTLISAVNSDSVTGGYSKSDLLTLSTNFNQNRSSLIATQSSIRNAINSIKSTQENLNRIRVSSTNSDVSLANANLKQALGSLELAKSNLAKTIIRTPISGVVNSVDVKTGDFLTSQAPVAVVANNNALEIKAFVNKNEADNLVPGTQVTIAGNQSGTITRIAPAVNSNTGKVEVIIATESSELKNGDSVSVTIMSTNQNDQIINKDKLLLPIKAVKLTADKAFIYTIRDNRLVANEVKLGVPNGELIEIKSNIDTELEIVTDARGLSDGEIVTVIRD